MEKQITYKPREFAELIGVSVKTLQRWDNEGLLKAKRAPSNRRYYTNEQLINFQNAGSKPEKKNTYLDMVHEYAVCKDRMEEIGYKLFDKLQEVLTWENDNLGMFNDVVINSDWTYRGMDVKEDKNEILFYTSDGWESKTVTCSISRLTDDSWRDKALLIMGKTKEDIQKEKEERELYEKLKAKYEPQDGNGTNMASFQGM